MFPAPVGPPVARGSPAAPQLTAHHEGMDATELYRRWLAELWNGKDPDQAAAAIVTPDFVGHWPGRPGFVHGPAELAAVVRQGREVITDSRFELVVGPIVQDDLVAARWSGRGRFGGRPVTFHGHDLLRISGDRFAEYWILSEDPTA